MDVYEEFLVVVVLFAKMVCNVGGSMCEIIDDDGDSNENCQRIVCLAVDEFSRMELIISQ